MEAQGLSMNIIFRRQKWFNSSTKIWDQFAWGFRFPLYPENNPWYGCHASSCWDNDHSKSDFKKWGQ